MKLNFESILYGLNKVLNITKRSIPIIESSNKEIKDIKNIVNKYIKKASTNKKEVVKNNNLPIFFK